MKLNKQLFNLLVSKLEVVVTVIWLLYFLNTRFPSPIPKLMNILSYPIIVILVSLHWKRLSWVATRDIPLLLVIGTACASVFWTVGLGHTLNAGRGLLRTFLFGVYFTTRYSLKEQMKILAWVFSIAIILTIAFVLILPSHGIDGAKHAGAWTGIFPHKNSLGFAMALGASFFFITAIKERKPNWLAWGGFVLAVVMIILARSSGALVTLLSLLSLMPIYKLAKQHYKLKAILVCFGCILVISTTILILSNMDTILVDILGEGRDFNGRTPIWDLIVDKTLEQPLLGYGLNAFWISDAGISVILQTWASKDFVLQGEGFNAHSGYFAFLPQLGFLGMSLYAISFVSVFIRVLILLVSTKKIEFFWLFQLLVFIAVANVGDQMVSIMGSTSYTSIYVSACLSSVIEWKRIRVSQKKYSQTNGGKLNLHY
ncbi:MAG: O-antigen ligase family protein [Cyanobacteria bacterium P01_A01_bin.83]